jgi:hypothetical protein
MVNIEFSVNIVLGILLIIAVLFLYFLRTIKYELSRDTDIICASMGFGYSCILIMHGWRLDPILIFGQMLLIFWLLYIGWENIRLRGLIIEIQSQKNLDLYPYDSND